MGTSNLILDVPKLGFQCGSKGVSPKDGSPTPMVKRTAVSGLKHLRHRAPVLLLKQDCYIVSPQSVSVPT